VQARYRAPKSSLGTPTLLGEGEGHTRYCVIASSASVLRSHRPVACMDVICAEPGISRPWAKEGRSQKKAHAIATGLHAYAVMSNHFHVVLRIDPTDPLSAIRGRSKLNLVATAAAWLKRHELRRQR
jgi:hypothetical protein